MKTLTLNEKQINLAQLSATKGSPHQDLTDYEQRVLDFCRAWLSGQDSFVLQTSGSTGRPKPITITRQQMVTSAQLTCQVLGLNSGDRALVCLSADYIAGRMMLVRSFECDLQLTIINPSGNPLVSFQPKSDFDFTALVPLQLQNILTDTPEKIAFLNKMKGILIGGAPVSLALQTQLQQVTAPIYHTYGMTETVTHIALKRLNGPEASDVFVPFAGVKLGLDGRGCLTINAPVTGNRTVVTNDLVELRPDGSFIWLGRLDNVINSGGVKVQTEKVERALEAFLFSYEAGAFAQRRFFVGPLEEAQLGQRVVAVIEGERFADEDDLLRVMREQVSTMLTRYELPKAIHFLPLFAETPTGKIDRTATLQALVSRQRIKKSV